MLYLGLEAALEDAVFGIGGCSGVLYLGWGMLYLGVEAAQPQRLAPCPRAECPLSLSDLHAARLAGARAAL